MRAFQGQVPLGKTGSRCTSGKHKSTCDLGSQGSVVNWQSVVLVMIMVSGVPRSGNSGYHAVTTNQSKQVLEKRAIYYHYCYYYCN